MELDQLVDSLSRVEVNEDVLFYEDMVLDQLDVDPNSRSSKVALGNYVKSVSRAITNPASAFILGDTYLNASNLAKADVIRNILEPGTVYGYGVTADFTSRFYNTMLSFNDSRERSYTGNLDMERIEAITANVIGRSLNNENITGASSLATRGYDQIVKLGNRDTVESTVELNTVVTAHREVRSDKPCRYCSYQDGRQVTSFSIGDEINRFHDNCSCELVIYYD